MSSAQVPLTRCPRCRVYLDAPAGQLCEACANWKPRAYRVSPYLSDNLTPRLAPASLSLLLVFGLPTLMCGVLTLISPLLRH